VTLMKIDRKKMLRAMIILVTKNQEIKENFFP